MILTGTEIVAQMEKGNIKIEPFNPARLNPNSYNLTLGPKLLVAKPGAVMRMDEDSRSQFDEVEIPEEGFLLQPGQFALASTVEYTETARFAPFIEGRSSVARLGLFVHITAGFGDVGFGGHWTLELVAAVPIIIKPGVALCQIAFHTVMGDNINQYRGKYNGQTGPQTSRIFREFNSGGREEEK